MRRLQLFITVVFLLFVFATPSFAVAGPTYDEDNLALINAAVSNELASADIPAGIEVNVEFGEITGYITSLDAAVGKELQFVNQLDIDSEKSGAKWAEEEAEEAITFETFLGAAGFYLGLNDGAVADGKTGAVVTTLEMTLTKAFLVEQGVSQAEADALFAADPVNAQITFFDKFTYFKIFDGADPEIDPRDIVEFVKSKYTDALPGFIEFAVDKENQKLTVGIRYILIDEAPGDGEPFVIDKNIVIYEDSEEDAQGVLFIFDGRKNDELRDPVSLGNEETPTPPSGSSGGCSTGLPLMLALLGLPVIFYKKK